MGGMERPSQLTIKRMLCATACFAVAASIAKPAMGMRGDTQSILQAAWFLIAFGAGIGWMFGRPIAGSAFGLAVLAVIVGCWFFAYWAAAVQHGYF